MTRASTSRWVVVCALALCTQACGVAFVCSRSGSLEADLQAGSGWSYSNTNYVIAGIIVGSVTGHSIGHEIRARILEPLAMTRTFFRAEEPIPVELSTSLAGSFNLVGEV